MHNLEHYLRQIRLIAEHREKDAEKKIRKLYKTLDKDLKEFLGTQYAELAQDGKLTYEILHSKKRYARFMEEVAGHVDLCSSRAAKQIKKTVNEIYALSFDGMIDAVEQSKDYYDLKANLKGVKATTPSIIKNAVSNSFLEDALQKNHASAIYDIKQNIGISLSNGDRIETTAKRLSEQINKDYNKSVLIARTESHRIREAGMQDSSEEIAKNLDDDYVMVKIWKTMKDERVRPQVRYKTKSGWKSSKSKSGADHMKMEGQTVLVDEVFDLGGGVTAKTPGQSGSAAHDCNCRCYLSRDFMTRAEYYKLTGKKPAARKLSEFSKSDLERMSGTTYHELDTMFGSKRLNEWTVDEFAENMDKYKQYMTTSWNRDKFYGAMSVSNQPVPKTLESIDDYLNKYLKKEVKLSSKQVNEINENLKEIIDKNDFCMRIPDEDILEKILDEGRFKNQMETHTSMGELDNTLRKEVSEQLFGINAKKLESSDFEKYGYLGSRNKKIDMNDFDLSGYGDVIVTFKRDNVFDRTTFTVGDSLNAADYKEIVASKVSDPSVAGINVNWLPNYHKKLKAYKSNGDLAALTKNPTKAAWKLGDGAYFELQYHGDLIVDDIESITVNKGTLSGTMIRRLKQIGIKVIEL